MARIEEMIRDLCPDGVHWVKLGEVTSVLRGKRLTKSQLSDDEKYPVYHGGIQPIGYYSEYNRTANTVMVINVGASAGTVGFCDKDFWSSDGCFCVAPAECVNSKFLYYLLSNHQRDFQSKVRTAGIPTLDASVLTNYEIPLPPLPIQEKIVEILEKFSLLSAELEAELEGRRKQYDFYRNRLLSFDSGSDSVQWKTLGEVAELSRGKVISKEYLRDNPGEYPVYSSQTANNGELGRIDSFAYDGDYLTWTTDGAYAGTVFRRKGKFNITNVCGLIEVLDKSINTDFLYYWLSVTAKSYVYSGMGNPKLMSNVMETINIPIPPLAEQERIVRILDKFEALVTDLSAGLPAEIERVQKQYEYYRNKLLTF